ncbi:ribosome silencing factor [Pseudobutyrivibrio sp.]|uniref:ribosome silencing factor n=1 Tax=Pseudobutyrivibrio sp. TaxID=2014367 RepID=UPI001DD1A55F|nr:ribosome silencing factor [Pseudobutyrivibrio sp.]MBE5909649.1 ribosome silencing factor [Pseudobutyrivibrio sp.]
MESREMAKIVCKALEDKKAIDVKAIDISEVSVMADYFIVASASNINQLNAMQDEVDRVLYEQGIHAKSIEGNRQSTWVLMDYEDVIVHLFDEEDRLFYDLERIWKDGVIIDAADL